MASNPKKGKEKKSPKKTEETPTPVEEKKTETPMEDPGETPVEEEPVQEEEPTKEPTPEPVYEEPVLTQLIVESYEGEKQKGLYEGQAEAYFTGGHHYNGMFHEGLMHGQGTYTWADGLVYEGDLVQNHVTGKGIYRWPDGSLYEGDVVDGLRHGIGTFRNKTGTKSYTGDWCQGKRHGKGRMDYDANGLSYYDGDWVNNIKHGFGVRQYPSGNTYEGMWFNNVRHGDGTMRWITEDQMYAGQWENSIQHGIGKHIWFLRRVAGSQYPLRNMYDGEFVKGKRQGFGAFFYANGARFEGLWLNDMKQGKGKFVFKNGRVYEGVFEKDHISEYPDFQMDGVTTPDLSQIRTRTPLPMEAMSVHSNESRNTYGPSFQLEVSDLLEEFTETDREEEASQVSFVITRHISSLRRIYNFYSALGYETSHDNTFVMNRMQFWRFLKDCRIHHEETTPMDIDRLLAKGDTDLSDLHNPNSEILFRQFLNHLIVIAFHVYSTEVEGTSSNLAWCLQKLLSDNILRHSCSVQGNIYQETRKALHALEHASKAYQVYQSFSFPRKYSPHEPSMKMRQFLHMMKDLRLVNNDLSAKAIIDVLASDNPCVTDEYGAINLELEMTFLEFFEALIGCAPVYVTESVVKDPSTPRPSTTLTQDPSMMSLPGFTSRASQLVEEIHEDRTQESPHNPTSPGGSPVVRAVSSCNTNKTGRSSKQAEAKESNMTVISSNSELNQASSRHTRGDSGKKSEVSIVGHKKSASFTSSQSNLELPPDGQLMNQSSTSLLRPPSEGGVVETEEAQTEVGMSEGGGDEEEEEAAFTEELDEATRQFNFWTHQIHIFFVTKFFRAADKLQMLRKLVQEYHRENV